jgi:hypothetical protein
MRTLSAAVSCLLVALWAAWGICDEPTKQPDISFAIPFVCSKPGASGPLGIERKGLCLGGSYRAGLPIVLVSEAGVFYTQTAESPADTEAPRSLDGLGRTYLVGSETYLASGNRDDRYGACGNLFWKWRVPVIAVISDDSPVVRHWSPKKTWVFFCQFGRRPERPFWVPIRLLTRIQRSPYNGILPPKVLTLGGSAVLYGDPVDYFINNRLFSIFDELELYNLVFSIGERVYLMRETTDCHIRSYCRNRFQIFDLSGKTPEMVY